MGKAVLYGLAVALAMPGVLTSAQAAHQRFHLLYTFHGADGGNPVAAPILDQDGNLYGTTESGGPLSKGTVYKLAPDGNETLLADFTPHHSGDKPAAQPWRDAHGNLFGTTFETAQRGRAVSHGTVFEITASGREKVLHRFSKDDPAGYAPLGGVIGDGAGNLYGTAAFGGPKHGGTVFKIAPDGTMTVLHLFHNRGGDGAEPTGSLTLDADGNLYGTVERGGAAGGGAVFKIAPDGRESLVFSFGAWRGDGFTPSGGVVLDAAHNIYVAASGGGEWGYGAVIELAPDGTETLLHSFTNYPDGAQPNGPLVIDAQGNLYGTTYSGGTSNKCGTVFEIAADGTESVLHAFDTILGAIRNGCEPMAGLAIDPAGNVYGTTWFGGGTTRHVLDGTVFRIDAQ